MNAQEVAQVDEIGECVVGVVAEEVAAEVGLDLCAAITEVDEGALAHNSPGGDPAGQADVR